MKKEKERKEGRREWRGRSRKRWGRREGKGREKKGSIAEMGGTRGSNELV